MLTETYALPGARSHQSAFVHAGSIYVVGGVSGEAQPVAEVLRATIEKDGTPRAVEVGDFWMAKCEIPWEVFEVYSHSRDMTEAERNADDRLPMDRSVLRSRPSRPFDHPGKGHGHTGFAVCSANFRSAAGFAEGRPLPGGW